MLIRQRKPYLLNPEESSTEVSANCAACGRKFHAYVKSTRIAALKRLQQNFNLHCRLRHRKLSALASARSRSLSKQMINGADPFAKRI